ncbi:FliM/FliN family flagellar motor switch protein [Rheinheimera sp.]|uniref:FliM/FliN family flagellar motor switch protein n=1 Tax=Rheinheimera sp. TaxID=1869214 RepID=UPI0027B8EF79|nr:FliM/FliN family flagellar motor switch protein [Rheinheimera sp.]
MSETQNNNANPLADLDMLEMDDLFGESKAAKSVSGGNGMSRFMDVPLTVTLEVSSAEVTLGELSKAQAGDVLALEKTVGEPLDVKVNGVLFAKAEVVMVNGKYGLKFVSSNKEPVDNG